MSDPVIMKNGKRASVLSRKGMSMLLRGKLKYGEQEERRVHKAMYRYDPEVWDALFACNTEEDIDQVVTKFNLNV